MSHIDTDYPPDEAQLESSPDADAWIADAGVAPVRYTAGGFTPNFEGKIAVVRWRKIGDRPNVLFRGKVGVELCDLQLRLYGLHLIYHMNGRAAIHLPARTVIRRSELEYFYLGTFNSNEVRQAFADEILSQLFADHPELREYIPVAAGAPQ